MFIFKNNMLINGFNNIHFTSCDRVYKTTTEIRTETAVNRSDFRFKDLAKYAHENFKDSPKVNIYSLACSDGSEALTMATQLMEISDNPKFYPIMASDIDSIILSYPQRGKLNMTEDDLKSLKKDGINWEKYFTPCKERMYIMRDRLEERTKVNTYDINENIKNLVVFERKSILQKLNEITNEFPNIVLCRNVLPYMGDNFEMYKYLYEISKRLTKNDLLGIGDFDRGLQQVRDLIRLGFEKTDMHNVFRKIR